MFFRVYRENEAESAGAPPSVVEAEVAEDDAAGLTVHGGSGMIGQPKFAQGFRFIGCNVFNDNGEILGNYLAAAAK